MIQSYPRTLGKSPTISRPQFGHVRCICGKEWLETHTPGPSQTRTEPPPTSRARRSADVCLSQLYSTSIDIDTRIDMIATRTTTRLSRKSEVGGAPPSIAVSPPPSHAMLRGCGACCACSASGVWPVPLPQARSRVPHCAASAAPGYAGRGSARCRDGLLVGAACVCELDAAACGCWRLL